VLGLRAARVSLILHLGDWTAPFVEDLLSAVAPVQGVAGNNDPPELLERLGTRRIVDVAGTRIGLTHGHLGPGRTTPQRAMRAFVDEPGLSAILFGHSHIPWQERLPDGRWLVNPGSPTDRRRQPRYTWALMEIAGRAIVRVEMRAYDDRRSAAPPVPGPEDHLAG
jgi:putative phosphoesterase